MPAPTVATDLFQAVDIERVEAPEVALGGVFFDLVAQRGELGLGQVARALVVDARVCEDGLGRRRVDAEDVLQRGLDALRVGDLDPGDTGGDDVEGAAASGGRGGDGGAGGAGGELLEGWKKREKKEKRRGEVERERRTTTATTAEEEENSSAR